MIDFDEQLRHSLRTLADEGRPVNLGPAALSGMRRRRRRVRTVAGALLAVVATLVPLQLLRGGPSTPAATDVGRYVVSAYNDDSGSAWLLDPVEGTYRRVDGGVLAVSPDLRTAVQILGGSGGTGSVRLVSTTGDTPARTVQLPTTAVLPTWSPDGRRLLLVGIKADGAGSKLWDGPTDVLIVEADGRTVSRLALPHPGQQTLGVWWLDDETLAVATAKAGDVTDDAEQILTYSVDGTPGITLPVPTQRFCGDGVTYPTPPTLDGATLLCGRSGGDTIFYRTGPGKQPDPVTLSGLPSDTLVPVAWSRPDGALALATPEGGPMSLHVVDLTTGRVGPAVGDLPPDARAPIFSAADGLSAAAAARAF